MQSAIPGPGQKYCDLDWEFVSATMGSLGLELQAFHSMGSLEYIQTFVSIPTEVNGGKQIRDIIIFGMFLPPECRLHFDQILSL